MKIDDNGTLREMTEAEATELTAVLAAAEEVPASMATRIGDIEEALIELAALLGGEQDG